MNNRLFSKTGRLSLFILRQDRIRIILWLAGILFFTIIVPPALEGLYPTQQDRNSFALTMNNPAMIAMAGTADLTNYTIGVMSAHQMLIFTAIIVGIMSILLVNRHTRDAEEDGRVEMLLSLPVGRLANLNANLLVNTLTNILLAILTCFSLYALQIEDMDFEGSLLYGSVLGASGIFFASITALFAQLSVSSRGTIGYSIAVLLISYFVRAAGDVSNETLSWLSPLGWVGKAQVYSENNWVPVLLLLIGSVVLYGIAYFLNSIRDEGSGFLRLRKGRSAASFFLQGPIGLAIRLQRTGIISWAVGLTFAGIAYGSVLGDLDSFFEGSELLELFLVSKEGFTLVEQFLPMLMVIMAIFSTIPPVMSMLKLYGEEKRNRIDHLLGRSVSRAQLMFSFLLISLLNGFIMLSLSAIGLWGAGTIALKDGLDFASTYSSAIVYYPAMAVIISLTALFIAYLPRYSGFIWLYVLYTFLVLYLGGLLQLPDWVNEISPFGHVPQIPIEDMNITPILVLTGIAFIILVFAFLGYKRRDIQ